MLWLWHICTALDPRAHHRAAERDRQDWLFSCRTRDLVQSRCQAELSAAAVRAHHTTEQAMQDTERDLDTRQGSDSSLETVRASLATCRLSILKVQHSACQDTMLPLIPWL